MRCISPLKITINDIYNKTRHNPDSIRGYILVDSVAWGVTVQAMDSGPAVYTFRTNEERVFLVIRID